MALQSEGIAISESSVSRAKATTTNIKFKAKDTLGSRYPIIVLKGKRRICLRFYL